MKPNLADAVVRAFGGLTPAARAIGAPISTVDGWRRSGRIPLWRRNQIIAAAEREKVSLPTNFLTGKAATHKRTPCKNT